MAELGNREQMGEDPVRKFMAQNIAWLLLNDMWDHRTVRVPGHGPGWELVSEFAERRPRQQTPDLQAVQRLLAQHATEGAGAIEFKERSGRITIPLEIDAGVFNPELTKASRFLLSVVRLAELKDKKFLDAFTGSGVLGLYAAAVGAEVLAYDMSAAAVACAQKNARLNELAERITVRQGDYTCLLKGERFDVIAANPPLLPVVPSDTQALNSAVFDPGSHATIDFIGALPDHLTPDGHCYLLTSSAFDQPKYNVYTLCEQKGLAAQLVAAAPPHADEWYRIHEIGLTGSLQD